MVDPIPLRGFSMHDGVAARLRAMSFDRELAPYRGNHEFHTTIQRLTGNRWLDRVTDDLRRFMRLMRGRQLHLPGRLRASLQEHRALLAAFQRRDAGSAAQLMHDHLLAQLDALKALRAGEPKPRKAAPHAR